jgi:acyl-CoA thioesterase-1
MGVIRQSLKVVVVVVVVGITGTIAAGASPARRVRHPRILILGDSLSAGYGVAVGHSWVDFLRRKLAHEGWDCPIRNASISGETSSGGRVRLPELLHRLKPRILILELGANDGLRGSSLSILQRNLEAMIRSATRHGTRVLLVGILLPPNYGPYYTHRFDALYPTLARTYHLAFVPFLLAHVATHRSLMQPDGLHPRARASPRILANVWPILRPLLPHACHRG